MKADSSWQCLHAAGLDWDDLVQLALPQAIAGLEQAPFSQEIPEDASSEP